MFEMFLTRISWTPGKLKNKDKRCFLKIYNMCVPKSREM